MSKPKVFISYARDHESFVDKIYQALKKNGFDVRKDTQLPYRVDIVRFMKEMGAGDSIVVVLSDKYLRSEYCIYEAKEMAKYPNFKEKVFPIILPDVDLNTENQRLYVSFWKEKLNEIERESEMVGFMKKRDYEEICDRFGDFIEVISRQNLLTAEKHEESGFAELIKAIRDRVRQNQPTIRSVIRRRFYLSRLKRIVAEGYKQLRQFVGEVPRRVVYGVVAVSLILGLLMVFNDKLFGSERYYVISASFRVEEEAEEHLAYLKERGYEDAEIITVIIRQDSIYAVSISSFRSEQKASLVRERLIMVEGNRALGILSQ